MNDERKLQFGYPEFWQEAVHENRGFYAIAPRLLAAINGVTCREYSSLRPDQSLILDFAMLAGLGAAETITLVGNGMGQGAMKIVRSILETAINAEYFRKYPDQAQFYLDWHWVETHKFYKYFRKYSPNQLAKIVPEQSALHEANYERVKGQFTFTRTNCDGSQKTIEQKTWCKDNLFDRATKTGLAEWYATVMPQANQILHGSVGGVLNHIGNDGRIDPPPSHRWGKEALTAAHGALIKVIETAAMALGVEPEPSIESLLKDYEASWRDGPNSGGQ